MKEIRSVLESGWTGQGPKCVEFEKEWDRYLAGGAHSHFVSSATAALHIAVHMLDLPRGTPVATTPITFVSTNAVLLYEGLTPVFCDCREDMSLSFASVKNAVEKKKAKAIVWVHYGGNVSDDFYDMIDYARKKKIPVIEDCAHAAGAFYKDGSPVGSWCETTACFSFHSVKNLPIFDGGLICTRDAESDARARRLSWLGIDKSTYARTEGSGSELYKWSYNVPELGWKYNGNDIAAAIGLVQFRHLDRDNAFRKWIAEQYELRTGKRVVKHSEGSSHHLVFAFVDDRDKVIASLKAAGIAPGVHYLPNYKFPVFEQFDHIDCKRVEEMAKHVISLPNHLGLTRRMVNDICAVLFDCGALKG
jgi:dTDP-4-amino-4,6-dideoxygalactose transaminase